MNADLLGLYPHQHQPERHVCRRDEQPRKSDRSASRSFRESFTGRYNVTTLVYAEDYQYVEDAIAREKQIKGWRRSKKNELVEAVNPTWADLLEVPPSKDPSLRSG